MRNTIKKILSPFLQKAHALYFSKPRTYSYKNISVVVEPTVFPPLLTMSTKLLLEFIEPMDLKDKKFLELGCGCGIISILAAKKNAIVTAIDINGVALSGLEKDAENNQVVIDIRLSDLFENLKGQSFDVIVINPPYYPKNPISIAERAWFCGEHFEYFERLFAQLPVFKNNHSYMILSEDCDLEKIKAVASKNEMALDMVFEKKVAGEKNYIFRIASL